MNGVRFPEEAKDCSSIFCVQIGPEVDPASYSMRTVGHFPGDKRGLSVTLTTHTHLLLKSRMSRSYTSSS
jgi:hypothetical protein